MRVKVKPNNKKRPKRLGYNSESSGVIINGDTYEKNKIYTVTKDFYEAYMSIFKPIEETNE
jgi:hypothetical protein